MRLAVLLVSALLLSWPAGAAEPQVSRAETPSTSPGPDSTAAAPTSPPSNPGDGLPVSLDKIREGLERPAAGQIFRDRNLEAGPDFRIQIEARRKIDELLATLDFKSGPAPAGGLYAYEQQRLTTPSVDNPLAQPYAAFNQGQLLTVLVENLAGRYLATQASEAVTKTLRARAEAAARQDVQNAVAAYCAAKTDNGAGIPLCTDRTDGNSR
jgi:hypothetical protein